MIQQNGSNAARTDSRQTDKDKGIEVLDAQAHGFYRPEWRFEKVWGSRLMNMHRLTKPIETKLFSWFSDQELAVIIGFIVLIFVSWGIYPLFAR